MTEQSDRDIRAQKEKHRSRVRSLRSAIIGLLFFWVIFSLVMLLVLGVKVFSLQRQVNQLKETKVSDEDYHAAEKSSMDEEVVFSTPSVTDDDNLAGLDDTLKVYLTFDDGPSRNTKDILKVLDDYGVKATFFVQGKTDETSKELMKQIVEEGHTIGMHTYSHSYSKIYSTLDAFKEDVTEIGDLIYEATGERTSFYRFPGGSSNGISGGKMGDYIKYINDEGFTYVDWNVASGDAANPPLSEERIVENVMKDVVRYKTSIVLLHDAEGKETTVSALPMLIERLREEGALLLPISSETAHIQHVTINQ